MLVVVGMETFWAGAGVLMITVRFCSVVSASPGATPHTFELQ